MVVADGLGSLVGFVRKNPTHWFLGNTFKFKVYEISVPFFDVNGYVRICGWTVLVHG